MTLPYDVITEDRDSPQKQVILSQLEQAIALSLKVRSRHER